MVVSLLLLSLIMQYGCKKAAEETPIFYTPEVSSINIMKTWMTHQKQFVSMNVQLRIDSLLSNADWQKVIQTKVSDGKSIFYVPLHSSELGIEFFYDNTKKSIDSGNLIKVESKGTVSTNAEIVASKTYYETVILRKASSNPFSGIIHTYSIGAVFLYEYTFDSGKIISHGIVAHHLNNQAIKKANGLHVNAQFCEEWGFYIIWEYAPPTLVYTFWVCSGMPDCPPVSALSISIGAGKQYVGVNCAAPPSDGGSPGGGVPQNETCNMSSSDAQDLINSFQTESLFNTSGFDYGDEVTDSSTGYTEKKWKPLGGYWSFFRGKIYPNFVITWGAYYDGIVFKNNATDKWKYKSIRYLYSQKVDGILPPCFSLDVVVHDLGSTILADLRTAKSEIHWSASLAITCMAGWVVGNSQEDTIENTWGRLD
jgi:hypothetical protein